jgi:hypothetical protein
MRQTQFRNRLVTLVGVFMLLGGARMYVLPAHASQGSKRLDENGLTTNGIHVNGGAMNGISTNGITMNRTQDSILAAWEKA